MDQVNVLVTGVGAIIGYGVIKSLRKSKYNCHIVGVDIYSDAAGQEWSDEFIQAIPAADPKYIDWITSVIVEKKIDIVFFGTEQEITRMQAAKDVLGNLYNRFVLNRPSIQRISDDKWDTFVYLKNNGIDAIPSMIEGTYEEFVESLGCPFLLKPRKSYAGKGIHIIEDKDSYLYYSNRVSRDQFMVQKLIGDKEHEYTVASFGYGDGRGSCPIIFQRYLSQEGATAKAKVIDNREIVDLVCRLNEKLKPIGPTDYQFRYSEGKYYLLEVNPRISSSTSIRCAFGFNEAEMSVDWFVYGKEPKDPSIRYGSAVRYIDDCVRYD